MLILRDTREQNPWPFLNAEVASLKTGDYTVKGLENKICIERKGCVEELATNLVRDAPRFERELERMREFEHRYIICEFNFIDLAIYPTSSKSKKVRAVAKVTGKFLVKRLAEIQLKYNVNVMFFDNRKMSMHYAENLMMSIYEQYNK